jgi:adenylate cyclase
VLAANRDIDMVVSDINMPRMDGLSLLQKLQEAKEQVSTVIVSAYGDMANIRTAMNRGAFDFLTKPIDLADLETTIAKTLGHLETLREARRRQAAAERAHAALSRYFSPSLAERLAGDSDGITLAGQRREVAAVFTDIEGFTSLVETIEPATLGELLNGYLEGMTHVVFSHEGTVAKVIGDALHVLFGAPGDQTDHAVRAVACALDLDAFAQAFRETWLKKGIALGTTRIGVNAGPAIVGNFGGGRFFDYTAYGDTINIAARLETANKQLGTRICVSESVAKQVPDFHGRPVGDLVLRGKTEPLRAFEPLRPEQYDYPSTQGYLQAFAKLESADPGALGAFAAEVGKWPDDRLAGFHLKRLLNGATGTRITMD